jgi:hypothetical protein
MSILRRIKTLEAIMSPPPRVPTVTEVDWLNGETVEEAKARFHAKWGKFVKGTHTIFVKPKKPSTPEERSTFARLFKEQQLASMENARTIRPKEPEKW